ncbi:uncharacterized protein LOC112906673 isoform X2 [Agrilus planipennis]|uniref:Uncharacterized protein LOC112906673 isoform X2 n=1 Tax=Agrilus planipennis TaxID=224129 RepID=A0A7F5RM07_AGRPL|nr:uncharacterized protein LOC112906673 isoform X2 [Agrilus planipennis]
MSASQRHPNQNEIDKCLQDAGVSDDLSFQEKIEFYNAIKVSESFTKETSASYEVESDNNVENENEDNDFFFSVNTLRRNKNNRQKTPQTTTTNDTKQCYITEDTVDERQTKEKENEDPEWQPSTGSSRQNKNLKRKLANTSQLDNAKRKANDNSQKDINIFDCTSQHSSLTRIRTPLIYEKPFLYSKKLDRMNFSDRLKAIYNHHFFLTQKYKQALQKSRFFINWGTPVLPSHNFNGSINILGTSFNDDDEVNFLLSQNGTHVESDNDADEKKSDTSKSVSPSIGVQHANRIRMENGRRKNSSPISVRNLQSAETKIDSYEKGESRTENLSPDILKDCLFTSMSINREGSGNLTRSEVLFNNLVMDDQKKMKNKLEVDSMQTLTVLSDEENSDFVSDKNSNLIMRTDDDAFIVKETQKDVNTCLRRRIVPPNPMSKKKNVGPSKKVSEKNQNKPSLKRSTRQTDEDQKIGTISQVIPEKNKEKCPICHQKFSAELIQGHAELCIESVESDDEIELDAFTGTIRCEICDKIFKFNTDYEIHVNQCIQMCK